MILIHDYNELLAYINKPEKQIELVVKYIGTEEIIEKIQEEEGPTREYEESHGFDYGPREKFKEYRQIDSDSDEVKDYVSDHYDDLFTCIEDFIDGVKTNKEFLDKFLDDDPDAVNLYNNYEDPFTTYLSNKPDYNEDFITYLCDMLF